MSNVKESSTSQRKVIYFLSRVKCKLLFTVEQSEARAEAGVPVSVRAVFVFVSEHLCVSKDTFKAHACGPESQRDEVFLSVCMWVHICVCVCVR